MAGPVVTGDDFYITLLKYVSQRVSAGHGVSEAEVVKFVQNRHKDVSELAILRVCLDALTAEAAARPASSEYTLGLESYFNLLEHTELQEARRSTKNAMCAAIAAMVISAGLAIGSVVINLWDIKL